jgi:enoyl-[acyl-carrier protein] reductase I
MADVPRILERRRGLILGMSGRNSIGYQCATALRALGAEVAVTYRPSRQNVCGSLAEEAGCALHFGVDADDEASVATAFQALHAAWGRLDFLVHTLVHVPEGVLARPLVELTRQDFHSVLDLGVHSLIVACRHATPLLERSNSPRVVTLTSASAQLMTPHYHAMGIAKAALVAAVRYLAYELGPRGILCNAVSFSLLPTDGAIRAVGAENALATHAALARRAPTRTPLEFAHVTGAIAFLVSSLCENTTGEVITVDGGFSHSYFRGGST